MIKISNLRHAESLLNKNVDFGEACCFQLAIEQGFSTVLMDDLSASYALFSLARAKQILDERYARGEITQEQYQTMVKDIL